MHLPMATSLDHGDRPGGTPVASPGRERVIERSVGVPLARGARVTHRPGRHGGRTGRLIAARPEGDDPLSVWLESDEMPISPTQWQ